MRKFSIYILAMLGSLLASPGCGESDQWKEEYTDLLHRSVDLEHRHCQLKASIDSLWDITSTQLEHSLPPGFPPIDRDIFLKARNADHIRMFMSYKQLDSSVQSLVDNAGKYDALLAAQVHDLLRQRDAYEQQKIQFLRKVAAKDQAVSHTYADALRSNASNVCQ